MIPANSSSPIKIGVTGDSGITLENWLGDNYQAATINVAQGTTPINLITGAPGYYLLRLFVEIDPTCTISGGGMVSVTFSDSVQGTIGVGRFYAPAAFTAPAVATPAGTLQSGAGYIFRSKNAGSILSVAVNNALTAGTIRCAVNGGLTPIF